MFRTVEYLKQQFIQWCEFIFQRLNMTNSSNLETLWIWKIQLYLKSLSFKVCDERIRDSNCFTLNRILMNCLLECLNLNLCIIKCKILSMHQLRISMLLAIYSMKVKPSLNRYLNLQYELNKKLRRKTVKLSSQMKLNDILFLEILNTFRIDIPNCWINFRSGISKLLNNGVYWIEHERLVGKRVIWSIE